MPPGLTFSWTGVIEGTPTKTGAFSIGVQVIDSSGSTSNQDSKRVSINILDPNGGPSNMPVITRVKVKGSKKLWVFGQNFHQDSLIILNGVTLTPKTFEQDGTTGQLFYKGKHDIGPEGTNRIFIQNSDNRSSAFIF